MASGSFVMKSLWMIAALLAAIGANLNSSARAEVTQIEVTSRTDVLAGKPFGDTGAYEKIIGKVYYTLDPDNPTTRKSSISTKRPGTPMAA
jgi:hypothetical protein